MSRKVRLTQEARDNIAAISGYIAKDSPENARRWRARIRERLRALGDFSVRHEIAYPAGLVGFDVRHAFLGVYHILYTMELNEVVVLTIRHGAREPLTSEEVRRLQ